MTRAKETDMELAGMPRARWRDLAARAQDLTRRARRFVHDRPLQTMAVTIGVGFVVGKILSSRAE